MKKKKPEKNIFHQKMIKKQKLNFGIEKSSSKSNKTAKKSMKLIKNKTLRTKSRTETKKDKNQYLTHKSHINYKDR